MKQNHRRKVQPFLAMMAKNLILLKRGWIGTIMMIGFPLLFVGFLVILINSFKSYRYPERTYVDTNHMVFTAAPSAMQPSFLKSDVTNLGIAVKTVAVLGERWDLVLRAAPSSQRSKPNSTRWVSKSKCSRVMKRLMPMFRVRIIRVFYTLSCALPHKSANRSRTKYLSGIMLQLMVEMALLPSSLTRI